MLVRVWKKLTNAWPAMLLGALCLGGCVKFVSDAVADIRRKRAVEGWPQAEGKVLSHSEISKHFERHWYGTAHVNYEYTVDGTAHRGKLGYRDERLAQVEDLLDRFPVGKTITVWHDPESPAESLLEHRFGVGTFGYFALGIGLGIVALAMFVSPIFLSSAEDGQAESPGAATAERE